METTNLDKVYRKIHELKVKAHKEGNKIYTNIYFMYDTSMEEQSCQFAETESALIFLLEEKHGLNRGYFVTGNPLGLPDILKEFPAGTVIDYNCKGENKLHNLFLEGKFVEIGRYTRRSTIFSRDGEDFKTAYSDILEPYYDENLVEYAVLEDRKEIEDILCEKFDKEQDHIPDAEMIEEWIKNGWVLISRHNNQIAALYIYQMQGKKMYSNFSYNTLTADVLYCLEKKGHLDAINRFHATSKYAWMNVENHKAMKRSILKEDNFYDYIYRRKA